VSRLSRGLLAALLIWAALTPAYAQTEAPKPLKVIVGDGELLFGGENLDAEQLRAKLAATGRQSEKILLQVGPTAKTVYIHRAIDAIHAAGFGNIALVGPSGDEIPGEPPI
jgi:biopolymer transport protein ExbD